MGPHLFRNGYGPIIDANQSLAQEFQLGHFFSEMDTRMFLQPWKIGKTVSIGPLLFRNGYARGYTSINFQICSFQLGHFFSEMDTGPLGLITAIDFKFQLGHFFSEMDT